MNQPTLFPSRRVGADTDQIGAYIPLPGLGLVPVNAYVIHAREPVLIDTGVAALGTDFMPALRRVIDPADLRWIWLTHIDADHVGNLRAVLAEAPQARIVTNYLGVGKLGLLQMPLERTYLINPGQSLDVGDRQLLALRPPVYDAPETMAVFDGRTRHLFSADCFGAVLAKPAESAAQIATRDLHEGLLLWGSIDAPWLHQVSEDRLAASSQALFDLQPRLILSSHLPAASGLNDRLYAALQAVRKGAPFVGPDQAAFEQSLRAAEPLAA